MAQTARVGDIDALKTLKIALWKFAEQAHTSLGDAESDMQRTLQWVENEQSTYWASEIRKRHNIVERCKEAVRMKKLFKDATGSRPSAVDEEKALANAIKKLELAQQKVIACKQWTRRLQKEILLYKGQAQRFATNIASDIPVAVATLENMIGSLEQYVELAPQDVESGATADLFTSGRAGLSASGGMARPGEREHAEGARPPLAVMRERRPTVEQRLAATDGDLTNTLWKPGAVSVFDREILDKIDLPRTEPVPEQTLVIADKCWEQQGIVLLHADSAAENDSGWCISPAGEEHARSAPAQLRVTVKDLLAIRPDLEPVLALPVGTLVVLDVGGVAGVLDENDTDVWYEATLRDVQAKEA